MRQNRAEGVDLRDLDVVFVDESKPEQGIVRSILSAARVARIRTFDKAEEAHRSMLVEPPHVVITDWHMPVADGLTLVRTMRDPLSGPLVSVPVILISSRPTRGLVEKAVGLGVHHVLAKPLSPATVMKRIEAVTRDARQFVFDEALGHWVLEDRDRLLEGQRRHWIDLYAGTRAFPPRGEARPARREPIEPVLEPALVAETAPARPSRCRSFGLGVAPRRASVETSTGQAALRTA